MTNFVIAAAQPVDLQVGPGGDLFYVDYGGTVAGTNGGTGRHRIRYQAPTAVATANPTSGAAPLTVQLQRHRCPPRSSPATP